MRAAGELTGRTLNYIEALIKPGISTKELDEAAEEFIRSHGAVPSFLNYEGFPQASALRSMTGSCTAFRAGMTVCVTATLSALTAARCLTASMGMPQGLFLSAMLLPRSRSLFRSQKSDFFKGLEQAVVGNHISDIGRAIQQHAESHGYGVVRELVGHGIGMNMHEAPEVPNYVIPHFGRGARLVPGMAIAIEPMINLGTRRIHVLDDGWTCVTADGQAECAL